MRRFNVFHAATEVSPRAPAGYRAGAVELGPEIGAALLGATVWDLPPGERNARYHYDHADEEWLLVLRGRPTVRHAEGEDALEPGDIVCFPAGPAGAHSVVNDGDEDVRMVMLSTQNVPTVVVYPDEGQLLVYTGHADDNLVVPRSAGELL
jgi:uncharacterized cupin superfamily protein